MKQVPVAIPVNVGFVINRINCNLPVLSHIDSETPMFTEFVIATFVKNAFKAKMKRNSIVYFVTQVNVSHCWRKSCLTITICINLTA